jgi:hypothetical protein
MSKRAADDEHDVEHRKRAKLDPTVTLSLIAEQYQDEQWLSNASQSFAANTPFAHLQIHNFFEQSFFQSLCDALAHMV